MAFESLTERLQNVFKNLRKKGKISEADVQEATKEIRLALLGRKCTSFDDCGRYLSSSSH